MPDLSPSERLAFIKTALKLKRTTFSAIARQEDLAPTTVAAVARGTVKSRRIEQILAQTIGFETYELWPDRYPYREGAVMS